MTLEYYLASKNTKFHPVTNNEAVGEFVATSNGNLNKNDSIFYFSRPVEGPAPVDVTITGPKGLYVALPEGAGENAKLIWSSDEYVWTISAIIGSSPPVYQIYPQNGEDLYWIDKFGIGNVIIVLAGKDIVPPQNYWYLGQADSELPSEPFA